MITAPDADQVRAGVRRAIDEDLGDGDLTAGLITAGTRLQTRVITREDAVLAGRPWFERRPEGHA